MHTTQGVPGLYKLIQGGSQWTAQLRDAETQELPTAAAAVNQLIGSLTRLKVDVGTVDALVSDVMSDCRQQLEAVLLAAAGLDEPLVARATHYDVADIPAHKAAWTSNLAKAESQIRLALSQALTATHKSAGLTKLKEAVGVLEVKERFNLTRAPPDLPTPIAQLWVFLGVPVDRQSYDFAERIRSQWEAHQLAFKPPPADSPPRTPKQVLRYWQQLETASPDLSALATAAWRVPVSAAPVERVFSLLTHMDAPTRRTMKEQTLYNTLFLRANWRIVDLLLTQAADEMSLPDAGKAAGKRRRSEAASAAGMAALSAAAVAL